MRKNAGFSLFELVIVMAILGFVSSIAATLLGLGVQGAQRTQSQQALDWSAREGLERLSRELRSIHPSLITTMTASQLTYTSVEGETVSFVYSGSSLTRNGQTLLNNISSPNFSFNYYTGAGATTTVAANVCLIQSQAIFTQGNLTSPQYVMAVATNVF